MEALLGRHVEIDAIGSQGKTALHHAIEKGNLDLVRAILEYKPGIFDRLTLKSININTFTFKKHK
jgi:ankyrin repeat protein